MSVIVTGGAGYIGSHIVEQLIKKRKKVIILDNLVTGHKRLINQKATFIIYPNRNPARGYNLYYIISP